MKSRAGFRTHPLTPKMSDSPVFKVKSRAEMDAEERRKYAEGGEVAADRPDTGWGAIIFKKDQEAQKYAEGGSVGMEMGEKSEEDLEPALPDQMMADDEDDPPKSEFMASQFAEGGEVKKPSIARDNKGFGAIISKEDYPDGEEAPSTIAAAILAKRRKEAMKNRFADGGMVDLDENAEEMPNEFDELNEEALDEDDMADIDMMSQPEDSNEHGHEMDDERDEDTVAAIRRHMRKMTR